MADDGYAPVDDGRLPEQVADPTQLPVKDGAEVATKKNINAALAAFRKETEERELPLIQEYEDAIARRYDADHPHNERIDGAEADLDETHDTLTDLLREYRTAQGDLLRVDDTV